MAPNLRCSTLQPPGALRLSSHTKLRISESRRIRLSTSRPPIGRAPVFEVAWQEAYPVKAGLVSKNLGHKEGTRNTIGDSRSRQTHRGPPGSPAALGKAK